MHLLTQPRKYEAKKMIELKKEKDNSTLIVGNFNIPLSINRTIG